MCCTHVYTFLSAAAVIHIVLVSITLLCIASQKVQQLWLAFTSRKLLFDLHCIQTNANRSSPYNLSYNLSGTSDKADYW